MQEPRAPNAAVATPEDDPTDAGPQAAVRELPAVPLRAAEGRLPLPGVGAGVTHRRLLGAAAHRPGPIDATTVNTGKCRLRQSRPTCRRFRRNMADWVQLERFGPPIPGKKAEIDDTKGALVKTSLSRSAGGCALRATRQPQEGRSYSSVGGSPPSGGSPSSLANWSAIARNADAWTPPSSASRR